MNTTTIAKTITGANSKATVPSYFGAKKKTTCAATGYIITRKLIQ